MIKIINNTNFCYKELGELVDNIQWTYQEEALRKQSFTLRIKYKRKPLIIHIRQMEKGIEWKFDIEEKKEVIK